jgi:hypothetical protein
MSLTVYGCLTNFGRAIVRLEPWVGPEEPPGYRGPLFDRTGDAMAYACELAQRRSTETGFAVIQLMLTDPPPLAAHPKVCDTVAFYAGGLLCWRAHDSALRAWEAAMSATTGEAYARR